MLKDTQEDPHYSLAALAVESNHMSSQESLEALDTWRTGAHGKNFGMFLVAQNYLSPDTLWELTRARDQQMKQPDEPFVNGSGTKTTGASHNVVEIAERIKTPQAAETRDGPLGPDNEISAREPGISNSKKALLNYQPGTSLAELLEQTMALGASDLHVHSGAPLTVRLAGELVPASSGELSDRECERLVMASLNDSQRAEFAQSHQVDFAFELPDVGRFRANAFRQQRGLDAVFRTIKPTPPTLQELGMPEELKRLADYHQGMVLFTGPAGCGKSSTMAALVRQINESRPDHILTVEDPVEYVHPSAACNVSQREIGAQTESFSRALRAALREDPDVIVLGELRDLETISQAITAAETGHLVLATLHTSNAVRTINRLLSVFPPEQQAQIRVMLSESLKAVISQRLVKRADGRGRVPAVEVMINNGAVGNLIRDNKTFQIKSVLQTGGGQGQRLLDASLKALLTDKVISQQEAIRHAEDPASFR